MSKITEFEKLVLSNLNVAINECVKAKLIGYGSPLEKMTDEVVQSYTPQLRDIVHEALGQTINHEDFKDAVRTAFDHKLARVMVDHLASSIDKAVNAIKSDPTLKARMILAVEQIINEK